MIESEAARSIDRSLQFHVRQAEPRDLLSLLNLLTLKAEFDGCLDTLAATSEQLEKDLFSAQPLAEVLLAEVDRVSIGFASYHRIYSTFLARPGIWLDDLFVRLEFRDQNIGSALMTQLCCIAAETGCARIDWTVATDNAIGICFYEKMGAIVRQNVRTCRFDSAVIAQHARSKQG